MKRAANKSMKYMKIMAVLLLACTVIFSGCIEEQNNTDTEPANNTTDGMGPSGEKYIYGTANIENIQIMTLESFPVQIHVVAEGYLPDGCTEIDGITAERVKNTFNINISTTRPKDAVCTQAIIPFNETIPLEVQGLKAGNYTVNVNGIMGSFELAIDNILDGSPGSMPPRQQVITETNNGTTISLKKGETFYLRLKENPTTGYSWEINLSKGLNTTNVSGIYYPPESKEGERPLVGAGGVHLWEIKTLDEGSQQVKGIYKKPWENTTGTEENFILNVEVV